MSLPWVRLETGWPANPKVLGLAREREWRALVTYVCGLCYAGSQGTDGYIPAEALPYLHARPHDASALVGSGLWVPSGLQGWDVHDWRDFQVSSQEHADRRKRAQAAAQIRWARERGQA